jgi:hypothetical protein
MGDVIQFDFAAAAERRAQVKHASSASEPLTVTVDPLTAPQQMWLILFSRLSDEQLGEFSAAAADPQCFEQAGSECQSLVEVFNMLMQQENV